MLRIRLQRFGKKKAPVYRISVIEKSKKRDGKPVEALGFYNPKTKELVLNVERAKYWQSVGAQATETVAAILKKDPSHDLASGPYQAKAKERKDKEARQEELKKSSTKVGKAAKKKAEAEQEAAAKKAEEEAAVAEAAKAEAEAAVEETKEEAEAAA